MHGHSEMLSAGRLCFLSTKPGLLFPGDYSFIFTVQSLHGRAVRPTPEKLYKWTEVLHQNPPHPQSNLLFPSERSHKRNLTRAPRVHISAKANGSLFYNMQKPKHILWSFISGYFQMNYNDCSDVTSHVPVFVSCLYKE